MAQIFLRRRDPRRFFGQPSTFAKIFIIYWYS
jgi:hypothetical protein